MFRKLGIKEHIIKSIEEQRFEKPSEIQEKAIPLVLQGKDVIAGSATGSGKTLVFGAGILHDCQRGKGIQALVLTPTRELAEQITRELRKFAKHNPMNIAPIYGGVSIGPQLSDLKTAEVVVGTPGRVLDHLQRDTLQTDNIKILVLDEADRMFDMGFIDDVVRIIRACPPKRQTLLFSATISPDIVHLARKYMKEPVEVEAEHFVDASKLHQVYYEVPDGLKFSLLVHLLQHEEAGLVMVFCNTRKNVDFVANNLKFADIDALPIHGGFSQEKRNRVMGKFHDKKVEVLVCTDVAARGLDIKGVSHIYNYDIPNDPKEYIHRIGRTARAGKEGKAVSLLSSRDYELFSRVLKVNRVDVFAEKIPEIKRVAIRWMEERSPGRRRFGGHSRGYGKVNLGSREYRGRGERAGRDSGDDRRDSRQPIYGSRGRSSGRVSSRGRSWGRR